ncbi:MAG: PQQ-binding-like beta-propeller repeat protein [Thermosynechococcaceae cyanobacterium]
MYWLKRLHLNWVVAIAATLSGTSLVIVGLAQGGPQPDAPSIPGQPLTTAPTRQPDWSVALETYDDPLIHQSQLLVARKEAKGQTTFLHAFDLATGKPQWKSSRPIASLYGAENNTIYASDFGVMSVVDDPKTLMTLDAKTGQVLSTMPIEDPDFFEVIGVSQGAFILNSYVKRGYESDRNKISARTATKVLWSFETPSYSQVSNRTGIVKNGVVMLPILIYGPASNRSYQLTALDATTGKVLWRWNTKAEIETKVLDDTVYASVYSEDRAGLNQGWVKAFDLKSGQERWTHRMLGPYPALANEREVFILDNSAKSSTRFVVLDKQTGQSLREITLAPNENPGGPVALRGNSIYKASMGSTGSIVDVQNHSWVEVFDATTGQLQWRTPKLDHSHVNFWVAGDRLIVRRDALGSEAKSEIQSYSLATLGQLAP